MARLQGADKVLKRLEALTPAGQKSASVEVGFRCPYALYVHENLEAKWRGKEVPRRGKGHQGVTWGRPFDSRAGSPKFLEKAYRRLRKQVVAQVAKMLRGKRSLREAILKAGEDILAAALGLVPIDTGKLYRSGYLKLREGG